jgi:hypothetical protein
VTNKILLVTALNPVFSTFSAILHVFRVTNCEPMIGQHFSLINQRVRPIVTNVTNIFETLISHLLFKKKEKNFFLQK